MPILVAFQYLNINLDLYRRHSRPKWKIIGGYHSTHFSMQNLALGNALFQCPGELLLVQPFYRYIRHPPSANPCNLSTRTALQSATNPPARLRVDLLPPEGPLVIIIRILGGLAARGKERDSRRYWRCIRRSTRSHISGKSFSLPPFWLSCTRTSGRIYHGCRLAQLRISCCPVSRRPMDRNTAHLL